MCRQWTYLSLSLSLSFLISLFSPLSHSLSYSLLIHQKSSYEAGKSAQQFLSMRSKSSYSKQSERGRKRERACVRRAKERESVFACAHLRYFFAIMSSSFASSAAASCVVSYKPLSYRQLETCSASIKINLRSNKKTSTDDDDDADENVETFCLGIHAAFAET